MEDGTLVSVRDLRDNLKDALKKSGALNSVKAHIRKEFISGLSRSQQDNKTKKIDHSLKSQLQHSIVYHHLKSIGLSHTLSVFVAESGLDAARALPERDILNTLKVNDASFTVTSLERKYQPWDNTVDISSGTSVLEAVMMAVSSGFRTTSECSVQTDIAGPGVRETLDNQIRELQTSYLTKREAERLLPTKTIEERMIAYQRECDERMQRELEAQVTPSRRPAIVLN